MGNIFFTKARVTIVTSLSLSHAEVNVVVQRLDFISRNYMNYPRMLFM